MTAFDVFFIAGQLAIFSLGAVFGFRLALRAFDRSDEVNK